MIAIEIVMRKPASIEGSAPGSMILRDDRPGRQVEALPHPDQPARHAVDAGGRC